MAETARTTATTDSPAAPAEPLWRELLGRRLRALRRDRDATLTATARRAGISPQYLSEIERGVKEPSSEMIAAVAGALDTTLLELTVAVARDLGARRTTVGVGLVVGAEPLGRPGPLTTLRPDGPLASTSPVLALAA